MNLWINLMDEVAWDEQSNIAGQLEDNKNIHSSLPNGKNDCFVDSSGEAGPSRNWRTEWSHLKAGGWVGWNGVWFAFSLGWLWALQRQWLRPKKRTQTNKLHWFQFNKGGSKLMKRIAEWWLRSFAAQWMKAIIELIWWSSAALICSAFVFFFLLKRNGNVFALRLMGQQLSSLFHQWNQKSLISWRERKRCCWKRELKYIL